jgi:hypothetical protein
MSKPTPTLGVGCIALCGLAAAAQADASPTFKVLYHEAVKIESHATSARQQRMHLEAYGKDFNILLEPNDGIRRAVPAARPDIQPLKGSVEGQAGSWARLTRSRTGWRGMVFDGRELYAIEPAANVADAVVQPLTTSSPTDPVMYRLADTLMTVGPAFCQTVAADDTVSSESPAAQPSNSGAEPGRTSAKAMFNAIARDLSSPTAEFPSERLMTGVVADYEFVQEYFSDPEGEILARMDIVDGIFSTQVGVKISLAPITLIQTPDEPFTKTGASDLLSQLRQYRSQSSTQMSLGVTHLMTGRNLDGNTVGIAYMGSVCRGDTAASLSEGSHSTMMSALIAAHELGHNFNAPHDGEAGACSSTPQTFLMAPTINMSSQFSSCSLQQMQTRIQTAQCLTPYVPPDVDLSVPSGQIGTVVDQAFTATFSVQAMGDDPSNNVATSVTLPAGVTVESATVAGGTCTWGAGTVSCQMGTLSPTDKKDVNLQLKASVAGASAIAASVTSSNDSDESNNSATITANASMTAAAPVTQPVVVSAESGSEGGGGGGGRIDLTVLALLSAILVLTSIREQRKLLRVPPSVDRGRQPGRRGKHGNASADLGP